LGTDLLETIRAFSDVHLRVHSEGERGVRAAVVEICKAEGQSAPTGTAVTLDLEPAVEPLAAPANKSNGRLLAG
jgi:hypothetical protein